MTYHHNHNYKYHIVNIVIIFIIIINIIIIISITIIINIINVCVNDINETCQASPGRFLSLSLTGHFSRFFIQSVTSEGKHKSSGGDSWRVYIRKGPTSLAPAVYDLNNGLYEVVFLPVKPGVYTANVWLDYTMCDGLREPPDGWFINGM